MSLEEHKTAYQDQKPALPLGLRISGVVALFTLILTLIQLTVGLFAQRNSLEKAYVEAALTTSNLLARRVEEALLSEQLFRLPELLKDAERSPSHLLYLVVCDEDGEPVRHRFSQTLPGDLEELIGAWSKPDGMSSCFNLRSEKGDVLHVVTPLKQGTAGYLHMGFLWAPVDRAMRESFVLYLAAMVGGLLVCTLVAVFVYGRMAQPIRELIMAARAFGAGKLDTRAPERSGPKDEAGLLAAAFNQMAARIEGQIKLLVRSRTEQGEKEARLQAILESMPPSILMIDPNGQILYANQAARSLWLDGAGLSPETYRQFHPERKALWRAFDLAIFEKQATKVQCPVGERHYMVVLAPLLGAGHESLGALEIATDVTDQVKGARALAHAEKLNVVGQLAAGVAHEIISPLDAAIEASKILEHYVRDAEEIAPFASMQRQVLERIVKIVQRMLTFARKPTTQEHRPVSIPKVIEEAQAILRHRFNKRGVVWESPSFEKEWMVSGDELGLVQVLVNLMNNALDVTPADGKVRIEAQYQTDRIEISVIDQGAGVSDEITERLYMPFFTTKDVGEGTGLGLAVSRNIVEEHGGRLYFENLEAPWGAKFTVSLPCKDDSHSGQASPPASEA